MIWPILARYLAPFTAGYLFASASTRDKVVAVLIVAACLVLVVWEVVRAWKAA